MKNNKSDRVKIHFAKTAQEMIKSDGVESVSVRKVAQRAGYSYATIYNHFKNLDQLLWLTRDLFIEDIAIYLQYNKKIETFDKTELIRNMISYSNYYINNKNIFFFLYFYKLDKRYKNQLNIVEKKEFTSDINQKLLLLSNSENISIEKTSRIYTNIIYSVHGLLTLSYAENDVLKANEINKEIEKIIVSLF